VTAAEPESSALETSTSGSLRVDFYVLEGSATSSARLRFACRLIEKAYLASQTVLVWHTEAEELKALDDLLWTFGDRAFVPHEMLKAGVSPRETPVVLTVGNAPAERFDIIVNLAPDVPPCLGITARVAEIIDSDEARRRAGRVRFKTYRDQGLQPASHPIRTE